MQRQHSVYPRQRFVERAESTISSGKRVSSGERAAGGIGTSARHPNANDIPVRRVGNVFPATPQKRGKMSASESAEAQVYLDSEAVVASRIAKRSNYIEGRGQTDTSRIDRVFVDRNGVIRSVVEIKTRPNRSLSDFVKMQSVWIDEKKIEDGITASKLFGAPFFLFQRTLIDDQIIFVKICDEKGDLCISYETEEKMAPKNCHGGEKISKIRAFIDIGRWTIYNWDGKQEELKNNEIHIMAQG